VVERHFGDGAGDSRKVVATGCPGQGRDRMTALLFELPPLDDLVVTVVVQILPGATT
jgi:hypothetical protein